MGFSLGKIGKSFGKVTGGFFDPIGEAINGLTGVNSSMDKSYQQQMSAMKAQNAYNTYMWNLQNQYNSPQAQLARMAEAGIDINPTSYALGTGNLSNTASLVGSASGFSGSGSPAGNPITMAMGVAQGIQGVRESKQRVENMKEQNTNLMEQGNILFNQMEGSRLANEIARHNLQYAQAHNMPVNSVPSIDSSSASWLNELLTTLKKGTN